MALNLQIWREIWTSSYMKLKGFQIRFNPKKSSPRRVIIKLSKIKNKERILKAARENMWKPHKTINMFLSRNFAGQEKVG